MDLLVVANRNAGSADEERLTRALDVLRAGAAVEVAVTADAADLDRVVADRAGRRLVVAGGDGSVHAVVAALDRAGALDPADPLGVVPLGTGNDLAGALGVPDDPAGAARCVLDGDPRRLDLLLDDAGGVVVNAVHAGIGVRAADEAAGLKERFGALAYPIGAAVAGLAGAEQRLRVTVDGAVVTSPAGWAADGGTPLLMVGVCNGPTIGGGTALAPGADPGDGLADLVVSAATGPAARAAYALALTTGRHVDRDDVVHVRGREVAVSGEPVALDADGDLLPPVPARTWRLAAGAWSVVLPRPGSGGR
ncbi:Diacylglycerol kinase family enzyme [Geodermatophilus saharensis]|uniref:Diacylglycerol kinase family enzyme n=1 Tax=Geodermatophilus saharensis TaxID=1137994 RepID=A0A239CPH6_9ACTN|nr:diacylglycerol kinase family protein [Geodermatophilus saharensis]SNS22037.1 Diacylglycerol kinase family enzyme [Geodermatophilus saharensis]